MYMFGKQAKYYNAKREARAVGDKQRQPHRHVQGEEKERQEKEQLVGLLTRRSPNSAIWVEPFVCISCFTLSHFLLALSCFVICLVTYKSFTSVPGCRPLNAI
jgi:hypothetical protein